MPIVEAIEALLGVTRRLFLILSPYQHPSPLPKLGRREAGVCELCATENSQLASHALSQLYLFLT